MEIANWHTYQVLTKRAERMETLLSGSLRTVASLPHIWWGVSIEDRRHGLARLDHLKAAPAAVRFLSIEPLLEELGTLDLRGIHWVIVGGESGPETFAMDRSWVEAIRDQCAAADVQFFFKQWGGTRKGLAGRKLDGRTYDERPCSSLIPMPAGTVRRFAYDGAGRVAH